MVFFACCPQKRLHILLSWHPGLALSLRHHCCAFLVTLVVFVASRVLFQLLGSPCPVLDVSQQQLILQGSAPLRVFNWSPKLHRLVEPPRVHFGMQSPSYHAYAARALIALDNLAGQGIFLSVGKNVGSRR